jgi:seryl-tRNA synthetase
MELEHEKRLTEVESRSKSNTRRLDIVEEKQNDLAELVGSVKVLADREARVEEDVGEIKSDVKELKAKPGKRWDLIATEVIKLLVVALLGFLLAKFGL